VYDAGREPDPRFSLANERTFLAWVRTALAMLAGAVALDSLGVPDPRWLRTALVVALVLFGGLVTAAAYQRWMRVEKAMRTGTPLPAFTLGLAVTVAIVLVAALLAVALAVS
jgi:putative membrane protein